MLNIPDFSKSDVCVEVLKQDKHTRLEGICIESFFREHYFEEASPDLLSTGWWFSKKAFNDSDYYAIKFCHSLKFNKCDIAVFNYLKSKGVEVFIILYKDQGYFRCEFNGLRSLDEEEITSSLKQHIVIELKPLPSSVKNVQRQNQAIDFLTQRGQIIPNAIERFFANRIAGFKGLWDVDMFQLKEAGKLKAFEVKQKFPAKNGCFGINIGTTNFLFFLIGLGIEVEHVILKKPVDDKDIPALSFIVGEEYKDKNVWLYTDFNKECILDFVQKSSPSYTSIHGRYRLSYYSMRMDCFAIKGTI